MPILIGEEVELAIGSSRLLHGGGAVLRQEGEDLAQELLIVLGPAQQIQGLVGYSEPGGDVDAHVSKERQGGGAVALLGQHQCRQGIVSCRGGGVQPDGEDLACAQVAGEVGLKVSGDEDGSCGEDGMVLIICQIKGVYAHGPARQAEGGISSFVQLELWPRGGQVDALVGDPQGGEEVSQAEGGEAERGVGVGKGAIAPENAGDGLVLFVGRVFREGIGPAAVCSLIGV